MRQHYPHATATLQPIEKFCFGDRWLYLYYNTGRTPSTAYSLYWEDELNPAQHAMTTHEVFSFISNVLESRFGEGELQMAG